MIFDCSKLHTNLCEFAAHRFKLTQADQRRPKMQSLHRILFKPSCTSTKKSYTFPSTIWFQAYFWLKLLSLFVVIYRECAKLKSQLMDDSAQTAKAAWLWSTMAGPQACWSELSWCCATSHTSPTSSIYSACLSPWTCCAWDSRSYTVTDARVLSLDHHLRSWVLFLSRREGSWLEELERTVWVPLTKVIDFRSIQLCEGAKYNKLCSTWKRWLHFAQLQVS